MVTVRGRCMLARRASTRRCLLRVSEQPVLSALTGSVGVTHPQTRARRGGQRNGDGSPGGSEVTTGNGVRGVYIQQAAAMVGTTASALRSWEKHGLVEPTRTESGYRVYSLQDIESLRVIQRLLNDGVNPAGILRILDRDTPKSKISGRANHEGRRVRSVGDVVRTMRARSGLTLRQVAEQTGLSPSYVSSIERSLAHPSIATLSKLAACFDTNVLSLMSDAYRPRGDPLVRATDRRILDSEGGVTIEDMSTEGNNLEPLLITIQPGAGSDGPLSHEGEEFLFVLSGEMTLRLDGTKDFVLSPGDSMAFASPRPHQFGNDGTEPVAVLWINTPRTF